PSTYYSYVIDNPPNVKSIVMENAGVGKLRPAPDLTIQQTNGLISLQWPAWASSYSVYTATNLTPPVVWERSTTDPILSNNVRRLSFPTEAKGSRFFRLQSQ